MFLSATNPLSLSLSLGRDVPRGRGHATNKYTSGSGSESRNGGDSAATSHQPPAAASGQRVRRAACSGLRLLRLLRP
jgi:hypothetical protein